MDLFSGVTGVSSGDVPREIAAGVVWDDEAERCFVDMVKAMTTFGLMGRGYSREDAERSARWAIEASLHRKAIKREIVAATRCRSPDQKREIAARWRRDLGQARADEIIRLMKDSHARKVVVEEW